MPEKPTYYLTIESPDEEPREYVLDLPVVRIGRDASRSDLLLPHGWVSRSHARIYCDREPYRIQDMGSSNGTQVNDVPLNPKDIRPLSAGDVIAIGPFRLHFEMITPEPPESPENVQPEADAEAMEEEQAFPEDLIERLGARRAPSADVAPPATPPPGPPPAEREEQPLMPWVGMLQTASRWLQYLPPIYAEDGFMGRFLLIFEDLLGPLKQSASHFDLFLNPMTAPEQFLPWLNEWMAELVDEHWSVDTQRELLRNASWLYQARGTRAGLVKHLEIATGCSIEIDENVDGPHTFRVRIHAAKGDVDRRVIERIVELNRPAHTVYTLEIV